MPETTDTKSIQPNAGEGSLVVGKIRPQTGLWPAIEGITNTDPVRNGVLIIFAENVKGRVGIFCNRYISGALNESTGSTGAQAAAELLSVTGGMFGFRPCMGNEQSELAQDMAMDLDELLLLRKEKRDIADALMAVTAPGKGERIRDTKKEPALNTVSDDANQDIGPAPKIERSTSEDSFSYMDWFAADEAAQKDDLPKFRQILMDAVPQNDKSPVNNAVKDLALYDKLLEAEKAKVVRDIELSMQRASQGTAHSGDAEGESLTELKMMSDFIQHEQARTKRWQGLDEIPTPRVGAGSNPGNIPRAPEQYKDSDLLSVSRHQIRLPKDFIKRMSVEAPPPKPLFEANWLRNKYVVGGAVVAIVAMVGGGITTLQSRSSFEDALVHAKASLKLQRAEDAVFVLNNAIAQDGSNYRAWFYRGLAYSAMGEYDKASKDFQKSIEVGGPRDRALIARASAALKAGKLDDAITDTSDVIKEKPHDIEALMLRATAYEKMKDFGKVIRDDEVALANAKDIGLDSRAHLLLQRGVAYMKDGKHAQAEQDLAEAIKIKPDAATFMQRGDAYRSLKDYQRAIADYNRVIEYDGRNYEAYVARGIAYGELHKESNALKDFARALAINNTGAEAMIQRGSMLLANGHYRLAANDLEDAMRLCPHDVETQQKLALAYTHLHKTFPKTWLHNSSIANESSASSSVHTASSVTESTGSSGIKMPKDTASLLSVGYKYLSNGEVEYATQMFSQAVKNEPNNPNARRYLAHALLQSGSASGAVSQFDALVDLDALTARDAMAYSKALISAGGSERAADVLAQCVQSRPRDTQLRAALVRVYASLGLAAKAKMAYTDGMRFARTAADKGELESALQGATSVGGSAPAKGADFGG